MRAQLLALLAAAALVPTMAAAAENRERDVAELTRLSDAWDKAIIRKDEKAIADNMAEDFRQIDPNANTVMLGDEEDLEQNEMTVGKLNLI